MAHHADVANMGLVNQTLDNTVVQMRAQQQQEEVQNHLNQLVDGSPQALAAPNSGTSGTQPTAQDIQPADRFKDTHILYNSLQRGPCYYSFAWLWCGCFEPKYKITSTYVIGEEWHACVRVTDSMAFENVDDVRRYQNCCLCMVSCCPCCPCFKDMADIILMGSDDSNPNGWRLKRLHNSTQIFDKVTRIIQDNQKNAKKK